MKWFLKRRRLMLATVAVCLTATGVLFSPGCQSFQMTQEEIDARFASRGVSPPMTYAVDTDPGTLFVAKGRGSKDKPMVVFIHGSPGSWDNYIHYFLDTKFTDEVGVAAIDRPGFGRSRPKKAIASLSEQARRIRVALDEANMKGEVVLVGHSLGGPVAARIAADYPDFVKGLVLVAPSMDPDLEKRRWYNHAAKIPPVRWALPKDWENSNEEIYPHKKELIELKAVLPQLSVPIIVIQGMEDELVPPGNADYVEEMMKNAATMDVWRIEGLNHFVPWQRPDLLKSAALELAD